MSRRPVVVGVDHGGNPFLRTSSYRRAQTAAQNADRGLWGRC